MQGDQQYVLDVGEPDQAPADQWARGKVELRQGFRGSQCSQRRGRIGLERKIVLDELKARAGRRNRLRQLLVGVAEGGAQHFVAIDDTIQGAAQSCYIQNTAQPQASRYVIVRAGAVHALDEPQTLLRER